MTALFRLVYRAADSSPGIPRSSSQVSTGSGSGGGSGGMGSQENVFASFDEPTAQTLEQSTSTQPPPTQPPAPIQPTTAPIQPTTAPIQPTAAPIQPTPAQQPVTTPPTDPTPKVGWDRT